MPSSTPVAADYASLDLETAQFLEKQTAEIKVLMKRSAEDIFEIGQKLIQVKKLLKHGQFRTWLEKEFDWTVRTASRFMSVAQQFSNKKDNLSFSNFAPSALYQLAAPSTADEVREEAIKRAEAGEKITHKKVKKLKKSHALKAHSTLNRNTRTAGLEDPVSSVTHSVVSTQVSGTSGSVIDVKATKIEEKPIEILSIRRSSSPLTAQSAETVETAAEGKQLQPDTWYSLQGHWLFHGYPNSPSFQDKLPEEISLILAFPPTADWQLNKPTTAHSVFAFQSGYTDLDTDLLRQTISNLLLLCTEEKDAIVFAFLPDSGFLKIATEMGCHAFIAEPDSDRCLSLLMAYQT